MSRPLLRKLIIFSISFFGLFILVNSAQAQLSCSVATSCAGTTVFKMQATSNAHAETAGSYTQLGCCSYSGITLGTSCSAPYAVVARLSGTTNAHVEKGSGSTAGYSNVCLSAPAGYSVTCNYGSDCSAFGSGYACLASISSDTNAHVGNCSAYPATKICCQVATGCTRANPTVTLSPTTQSGSAGQLLSYTVSIKNNDNSACGASTFNLTYSCPTTPSVWPCSLNNTSVTISPGSTDSTTTLSVASPAGTPNATYMVSVTATNSGATSYSGTGYADYVVTTPTVPISQPVVTTLAASNIAMTTATLNGNLSSLGYDPVVCTNCKCIVWFEYKKETDPDTSWIKVCETERDTTGSFSCPIGSGVVTPTRLLGTNNDTWDGGAGGQVNVMIDKWTAVATGNVTEIRVKVSVAGTVKVALYADSSGNPGTLLSAVNTAQSVSIGWNTITLSTPVDVTQNTVYWIGFYGSNTGGMFYYRVLAGRENRWKAATYSTWTWPNPAGTGYNTQTGYEYANAAYGFIAGGLASNTTYVFKAFAKNGGSW